jgi:L-ascorbate metabolism protein UlaG (beta-lactamase superfamily)
MNSSLNIAGDPSEAVKITWLGHSMFLLDDGVGHRLVTDPYDAHVGYALPDVEADLVLVSHGHGDHSNVGLVKGNPMVIQSTIDEIVDGIPIKGYATYHDGRGGAERGSNIVYRWQMRDLTFVHLGDLGHVLSPELIDKLANPDVLFVPVGGYFTIDDVQAEEVVKALAARIAVPMHFKNAACGFPIQTEEPFVSRFERVTRAGKQPVFISKENIPAETHILLMDYIT